jgi:hypothetical protein
MVLPGDCTHARGRSSRGALAHSRGTLRGTIAEGAYYTAGHSMGSSAHSRGFNAVLKGYSRGTLVRHCVFAAGVTWTSRTLNASWAARSGHTTVIDAAGAIYVIGGVSATTYYREVWVSTDGGADRTRREELL